MKWSVSAKAAGLLVIDQLPRQSGRRYRSTSRPASRRDHSAWYLNDHAGIVAILAGNAALIERILPARLRPARTRCARGLPAQADEDPLAPAEMPPRTSTLKLARFLAAHPAVHGYAGLELTRSISATARTALKAAAAC